MQNFQLILLAFSSVLWSARQDGILAVESKSFAEVNRTVKFSLTSRKNQTGHSVTRIIMDKSSMELPDNWNVDIENSFTEFNGIKSVQLLAVFTVPPPVPADYDLFPGIGYYKFHRELAPIFDTASEICFKEGGHLAIINSLAESQVMQLLWRLHPENETYKHNYAFIGIHDRLKEGEFTTIFGYQIFLGNHNWHRERNWHRKRNWPPYPDVRISCAVGPSTG
ncbi:hemolymph lipopolysaccharide-binding protein-like isoform X2 [Hetaerina americana]|uniref:hemolymph lipopolysaccharide-binding protein-like isoform X2 n=1 Tax=Hetaerina americana TaxID=62018 RepID=UPI003A7F5C0E